MKCIKCGDSGAEKKFNNLDWGCWYAITQLLTIERTEKILKEGTISQCDLNHNGRIISMTYAYYDMRFGIDGNHDRWGITDLFLDAKNKKSKDYLYQSNHYNYISKKDIERFTMEQIRKNRAGGHRKWGRKK